MDKNLIRRLVMLGLFLVVLFGGIFGWRAFVTMKARAAMAAAPPRKVTVSVAPVRQRMWAGRIRATASLKAVQGTMLSPQLGGMVTRINFHSGEEVKSGQLLVQINDSTQRAQLQNDQAALKLAKIKLGEQKRLYKSHNTSKLSLESAQSAYEQASAAVSSDRATLAKLQVHAPFSGHLGLRQVSLGQYVTTSTPVVDLQQWNPIYADFQVPQQDLAVLSTGDRVSLVLPGDHDEHFVGEIDAIGAQVQSGTRNVQVQATFANAHFKLRPGMYGEVSFQVGKKHRVLTVPDSAITYNTYGEYVYVIRKQKRGLVAKEQTVKTGSTRNGVTVVTQGLKPDESVVTAGQVKLHPGALVVTHSKGSGSRTGTAPSAKDESSR